MPTSTLTKQQQNEEDEEEVKEEEAEENGVANNIIFLTTPRERDIILLLNNNNDNDDDEEGQQQQQQQHIGNIRYQNFIDNVVLMTDHHRHHSTTGSSIQQQNNSNKVVSNIIDTIYRNKGSFITKQYYNAVDIDVDADENENENEKGIEIPPSRQSQCQWSTVIDRDIIGNKVFHSLIRSRSRMVAKIKMQQSMRPPSSSSSTTTTDESNSNNRKRKRKRKRIIIPCSSTSSCSEITAAATAVTVTSKKGKKIEKIQSSKSLPTPPTTTTTPFTSDDSDSDSNSNSNSSIAFDDPSSSSAAAAAAALANNTTVPPTTARIDNDDNNDDNNISDNDNDGSSSSISSSDINHNDEEDEHEHQHEHEHEHEHEQNDYKYYEKLSSGCLTFGQSEENYEDIVFRSCKRNNGWKEQIREDMKMIRLYHTYANHGGGDNNGIRLRILFSSRVTTPQDVMDVLQYMIDSNFFNNNNNNAFIINHLAFGLIEVVNDYELDIRPISFPINIFGEVLKSIMTSTSSEQGGSIPLQSLNIKNIKFIGTRNDEFNNTFEQLSKCNTIQEFICESCRFQVGSIRNATNSNNRRVSRSCSSNIQINNLMFNALQKINSLEVLSIDDIALEQCSDTFNHILLNIEEEEDLFSTTKRGQKKQQQQKIRKKKKKLKVLSIRGCTISDSTLKIIFGGSSKSDNSRVEKVCLVDVVSSKEQRCKLIQYIRGDDDYSDGDGVSGGDSPTISKNRNRSLKYLSLNWSDDDYLSVSQTIDLMNALGVNNSLKVLHLGVDCTSNALCDKESSFINSIQKLSGLQILYLTLRGMSGQKGLDCISSIVRNGIGQNTSLKKVDFLVSGYCHRRRTVKQKDNSRNEFSNALNSSLIHALTTTSSPSSCDDRDGDENDSGGSTRVSRESAGSCSGSVFGCVLEDFHLYVDGTFSIDLNDEVQFWLSMNETNLKQKLMSDLNNYKLWIDSIIENQLDEKIVHYLLRQNPALLLFLLPPNQQNNQPNDDHMITTSLIEEVV